MSLARFTILVLFLISFCSVSAQDTYVKKFASTGDEFGQKIIHTSDGNLLMVCRIAPFGVETRTLLVKMNLTGDMLWTRYYEQVFFSLLEKPNGDLLFAGKYNNTANGEDDLLVMRTDSLGNILWSKRYAPNTTWYITCFAIEIMEADSSGAIIAASLSSSYPFNTTLRFISVFKIDSTGNIVWMQSIDGNLQINSLIKPNQDYIIGGIINSGFSYFSITENGTYSSMTSILNSNYSTKIYCTDTNYIFLKTNFSGKPGMIVLNDTGAVLSSVSYNISGDLAKIIYADTAYYIMGTDAFDTSFVIKANANGIPVWSRLYQSPDGPYPSSMFYPVELTSLPNRKLLMISSVDSNGDWGDSELILMQTNDMGDPGCFSTNYPITYNLETIGDTVQPLSSFSITYSTFSSTVFSTQSVPAISTYCSTSDSLVGITEISNENYFMNIYPNPSNEFVTIEFESPSSNAVIEIYDVIGNVVKVIPLNSNKGKIIIDNNNLPSGIYFTGLMANGKIILNQKMIVTK